MIQNKDINFIYFNKTFNKSRLKKLIYWSINLFGEKKTVDLIEILKKLGYSYATRAGLSLSIDDLKVPLVKNKLLVNTEYKLNYTNQDVEKGYLTSIEYFAQVIDTWNNTNDILKQEVINNFKIKDVLNPVYMMAFSGARGNISQVRQLVGMRGLMADPSGRIINFPIQSNFREGLTLTEYVISCYGARKGVVDTALRTATSGYLTRRLVDVAQHVIIRVYDCLTLRGIYLTDLKINNNKKLLSLKNRLIGRVLAEDVYNITPKSNLHSFFTLKYKKSYNLKNKLKKKIAIKNEEITNKLVDIILKNKKPILVRSPLTCQDKNYVCQLCYGWSLSSNRLVSLGESVGIIAAQSIGEPGTQLTMRTFHTGGVFSGHSSNEIIAQFDGKIEFPEIINGKLVRTTHGKIAFLIKQKNFLLLKYFYKEKIKIKKITLPFFTLLFVKQGQKVYKNQVLAEPIGFITELEQSIDVFQTIYSEFSGEIRFKNSKSIEKFNKLSIGTDKNLNKNINSKIGQVWVLASHKQTILKPLNLFLKEGDFLFLNSFICLYNFLFLNNNIKTTFLNNNIKTNNFNLVFMEKKLKLNKLKIFNFFKSIKNTNLLNYSILELSLFIKSDYFQLIKLIKQKYFNNNRFKKLKEKDIIYSNISKNNLNYFKFKKSYFLSNFNLKKYSYGLKSEFIINLNPLNKLIFFENKITNYSLPIILFYFCIYSKSENKLNKNKFELLKLIENKKEKVKIINYYYVFKIPFNFICTLNSIWKNNFKFFYNLNIHKLNLNYKILFKLKNLKLFLNHTKIKKFNNFIFKTYNKKFFISSFNHFSIYNTNSYKIIENVDLLYFFKFNNNYKKIKSYFYNKSSFNFNEIFLFNNFNKVSYLYINNLIKIFNNFNKNISYLLFINSSLNFFILTIFYKLLNKNKATIKKTNLFFLIEKNKLNLKNNKNNINFKKIINFEIYFNKKIGIWSFYFLLPTLKTTINSNNFSTIFNKIKNKSFYNFLEIKEEKDLFFYNFSLNIIKFYKSITFFSFNSMDLKKIFNLDKKKILLYNINNFNVYNIYLFKSNIYNLNYFNYLFLSFLCLENEVEKNKNNINKYFNKINKLYYNKSFLLFNIKKIKKSSILKKFILKQKNLIYFKIKNNNKVKKTELKNFNKYNFYLILFYFVFNINFLSKLNFLSNFSLIKIKNKYKINKKKKKILYLKKDVIYFYFSSYVFSLLLSDIKIQFFNLKYLNNFNFSKIILTFLKLKKINYSNFKKINILKKNLKILYFFKYNINIGNNIKYNLIFYNIIFYKFIKNINLILIIFYKFIKKFNNRKVNNFINKINKKFFSNFSINNIISYNDLLVLLFYYRHSILDFNINKLKKFIYIKKFDNINDFFIFDKNKKFKNILFNKKKIEDFYLFLNQKNNSNFNISTIWFSKTYKLKTIFKFHYKNNCKYYNLNSFKIKNNNKFKIIIFNNYNFFLPFKINYINSKLYKNNFNYKNLNFLITNNKKIKIKNKNNINYKIFYFYFLINNKILKKLNNICFKNSVNKDVNLLNKFLNLLIKYENIVNFINLNNIFENRWIFYFNNFNINTINIKINFNFLYKKFFIINNINYKIILKKNNYFNFNINFFNQVKKLINNKNFFIFKNYWIVDYLKRNFLLFNKFNYYYDYWLFYKFNFNFLLLSNLCFKNINENIIFLKYNTYKKYNFKKILVLPIQILYIFKIQSKINLKKNKLSIMLIYFLFNFNKNKKIEIKQNNLFNFFKLKYFNLKLKYFLTQYNNIYVKKIFLININYILIGNLYNLKKYKIFYLKNKKLQKKFKIIFTEYNDLYLNKKKTKLLKYYTGWFYIINKSDFLFLNSKKLIPSGFFINKYILFENKIILNKFFTFRFKNNIFKNLFNFRIYLLKSFINFKIKKNLLNSIFIFYGSRFFNFYLQKSIFNFNNFIFNSYKIIKNKNINFSLFINNSHINKWFIFTKFYFYKIRIKFFIYKNNKKLNNKKLNINLLNNYYRTIFLQTTLLKKVKNYLFFFPISLKLIKNNIFNKKNYLKKSFFNSNILINNFLNIKNSFINFKRIFLIDNSKIIFNNYNRYKPKLFIYKIIFKSYNLIIKINTFKNICIIKKSFYFNNLDIISNYLFFIENKLFLLQNDLRYYILKFPFKNNIKIKTLDKSFIYNKKKKIKNLFKFTYSNYLFLNKNKIDLLKAFSKNNKIKNYFYNYLLFINKKTYKIFYDLFYLKGYKYLNKINFNILFKRNSNKSFINKKYLNILNTKINNKINFIINKKNLIVFFINNKNYYKVSKLYLIKTKENYFFNFNISNSSYTYFYKDNLLNNNINNFKKYSSLTVKIINKKINTNILNFSKKFNINYYKFRNIKRIEIKKFTSNIYINFKPFLIEKNNFLIQLNFVFNFNSNHILLFTSINKISNNVFNKLKLIKIKKMSINFNNYKIINNFIDKKKLNNKLSIFKGEVLNTYNFSFLYYYNYLKKNKNIKNINYIFDLKNYLKEKISLFPEIFYLTNDDFLTYKIKVNNNNKFKIKLGEFVSCSTEIILNSSINQSGQIIFLNKNKILLRRAKALLLSAGSICNLKQGDFINNNSPLLTLTYKNLKTEDIVQGIPKIEQIFEARENLKDKFSLNSLIKLKFKNYKKIYSKKEAVHKSIIFIQQYIVDSVQKVYQSQGVNISDKHIEIIVKQMTSKVRITDPGTTGLLRGDIVYLDWIELINNGLKGKKSQYEPIILGISRACLEMDGFISAASFQETIKILSKAAILQKRDFLRGLKENLILGHLVPVGTGFEFII